VNQFFQEKLEQVQDAAAGLLYEGIVRATRKPTLRIRLQRNTLQEDYSNLQIPTVDDPKMFVPYFRALTGYNTFLPEYAYLGLQFLVSASRLNAIKAEQVAKNEPPSVRTFFGHYFAYEIAKSNEASKLAVLEEDAMKRTHTDISYLDHFYESMEMSLAEKSQSTAPEAPANY
jgi:hypothetical protein